MKSNLYSLLIVLFIVFSCEKNKHNSETSIPQKKINEETLIFKIDKALNNKNYIHFKNYYSVLKDSFPESNYVKKHNELFRKIVVIQNNRSRKDSLKKEKQKIIDDLKNTGNWQIGTYVDKFGKYTDDRYIYQKSIKGLFSNTATKNSDLKVDIFINKESEIYLKLYEYAGDNPVKRNNAKYSVFIINSLNEEAKLKASNHYDRFFFNDLSSKKINEILLREGVIKFVIYEKGRHSEYKFELNANRYKNTFKVFQEITK